MTGYRSTLLASGLALLFGACASMGTTTPPSPADEAARAADAGPAAAGGGPTAEEDRLRNLRTGTRNGAWRSTYSAPASAPTLIRGATIMTAAGEELAGSDILLVDGRIADIGERLEAPAGANVIDGTGRFVTPGLIDTHSHLGVSATPEVGAHFDNNDTGTTTPQLWIEHSIWPQGPGFSRALAGGVTTAQLLPGSGDLIEGRGATIKLAPARTPQAMLFPDAPHGLKMACGENPKGGGFPSTRMGNVSGYRAAFNRAQSYRDRWDEWLADPSGDPPSRDLANETLAEALRGNILLHVHCYRADDIANVLEVAREFDLQVRSFHHGVEAYKVRDLLAEHGAAASVWADWWGFKMEAFDGIPENAALLHDAGARAIIHSDSDMEIQRLNQEAAKAFYAGQRAGIPLTRDDALRWITANPAWALGLEDRIGTLEAGKNADVVLWSGDPLSVYSRVDRVWIDGVPRYDRADPSLQPQSDFELGILPGEAR